MEISELSALDRVQLSGENVWVNVEGLENNALIDTLTQKFGLHELIKDDVLNMSDHPIIEFYDDQLFVVLRMLSWDKNEGAIAAEHVSIVLGKHFLITFQEGLAGDVFDSVRARFHKQKNRLRNQGIDFLCYQLLDAVVDNYLSIIEGTGEKIEMLEDQIIEDPQSDTLVKLHNLRNDLLSVKKSVLPLRSYLNAILLESSPLIAPETVLYLRDLYNHINHEIEQIESYREIIVGIQDLYLSTLSTKMNQVMKVLTIITTIFIPLSFIAGVYGMNFKYMPELESRWGYPVILGVMLFLSLTMISVLKKKKWF